ncbi:P-loop containing nucleoside triphosphate hydrolase protein [Leucogyrophana mollusca]|uniref:P-loop containing nucleoside triphosphate hydrolase protein n=1 Tax=Leucogyrophana mollusca TaxID=85980 RepID=A0ACB8BSB4_9AGAM|nr:P-loop containing nucleoside triphosphate hydrolase protein [Leucogyrophana mollusca]
MAPFPGGFPDAGVMGVEEPLAVISLPRGTSIDTPNKPQQQGIYAAICSAVLSFSPSSLWSLNTPRKGQRGPESAVAESPGHARATAGLLPRQVPEPEGSDEYFTSHSSSESTDDDGGKGKLSPAIETTDLSDQSNMKSKSRPRPTTHVALGEGAGYPQSPEDDPLDGEDTLPTFPRPSIKGARKFLSVPQPSAASHSKGRIDSKDLSRAEKLVLWKYQATDLESIYRREMGKDGGSILAYEMGLGKTIVAIALIMKHLKEMDKEADMVRQKAFSASDTRRPKTTLVVVPEVGLLTQWIEEVRKFGDGLTVRRFVRGMTVGDIEAIDVILTTYTMVGNHYKAFHDNFSQHPDSVTLFKARFLRVILDEAHKISNRKTLSFKGCNELKRECGLCLTGTPMQNKFIDVQPLLEFLRAKVPHNLEDFETFKCQVLESTGNFSSKPSAGGLADALKSCMIYRRKEDVIKLPELTLKFVDVVFTAEERRIHDWARDGLRHTDIALLRARQSCDHPYLLTTAINQNGEGNDMCHRDSSTRSAPATPAKSARAPETPRAHLKTTQIIPRKSERSDDEGYTLGVSPTCLPPSLQPCAKLFRWNYISSKMMAVLNIIRAIPEGEKAIIFSHWRMTMTLLEIRLGELEVGTLMYHGDLSSHERILVLRSFASDPAKKVLLNSMRAGGVGLNIASANHVLLVEPWWNPFAEAQAFSRAHRIGQNRPVTVYRFCVKDSAEVRVVKTQKGKLEKIAAVMDQCALPPML